MTTHEIIKATVAAEGDVFLTIRWDDAGHQTTERTSVEVAKALGWRRPDPQPVDPAWMVEVAREGCAIDAETLKHHGIGPDNYRSGAYDDTGAFRSAMNTLRLALSRGHVVLAPVMPSEEEMLKGAREDAALVNDGRFDDYAAAMRAGRKDYNDEVQSALQARRNVYASLGAVKAVSSGPVVPEVVGIREMLKKAWEDGYSTAAIALDKISVGEGNATTLYANEREKDVSAILENLKSGEA